MIELQDIQRSFQVGDETVHALRDLSLQLTPGDYVSLMGPSGSGKSTLLNILGLLDHPDQGHYQFEGTETTSLSEEERADLRRHKVGFVFQAFHLVPRLTAFENVELPMMLAGIDPEVRKPQVAQTLEALSLSDRSHHRPDQLSGGQRQRVAIARATIMHPTLLLADEPTGNLDKHSGQEVVEILERLNRDGITLIIVTHDPEIGSRAKRQIQMIDGAIV